MIETQSVVMTSSQRINLVKIYSAGWSSSALPSCPTATAQNAETWPHPNYEAAGANFVNNQHLKHEVLDFDREIWRKVISILKFYDTFAEAPPICLDYIRYYIDNILFCHNLLFSSSSKKICRYFSLDDNFIILPKFPKGR